MPREDTQFKKGHARPEKAGHRKGTPNKPKSIRVAMREFTDEQGGKFLEWANKVFESADLIEVGEQVLSTACDQWCANRSGVLTRW